MNDQRKGGISWTDFTWSPIRYRTEAGRDVWGCVKISPACKHCYAESIAVRFARGGPYTAKTMGALTPYLHEGECETMLRSRAVAGKRVFVEDMSDLFGEWNSNELIAAVFGVMAARRDVTFQVLTKRSARMRRWVDWAQVAAFAGPVAACLRCVEGILGLEHWHDLDATSNVWPLPNVWLGATVEDQPRANERIPDLLACPAAVHWISAEPMLGPIELGPSMYEWPGGGSRRIDWVICGGESGPRARPMHRTWARSLRDQCVFAGVPFFFKQWGEWAPEGPLSAPQRFVFSDGRSYEPDDAQAMMRDRQDRPGGGGICMYRVGKNVAGALLDGVRWKEISEVPHVM